MEDYSGLHWMTAGLFVAAGAEAALGERRGDYRSAEAIRWAPFVAAPIAGAAQAARALAPTPATQLIARVASAAAIGVGLAGLINSIASAHRAREFEIDDDTGVIGRIPSLAPLAFGAVGLLALLLDDEQEEEEEEEEDAAPESRRGHIKAIRIRV